MNKLSKCWMFNFINTYAIPTFINTFLPEVWLCQIFFVCLILDSISVVDAC